MNKRKLYQTLQVLSTHHRNPIIQLFCLSPTLVTSHMHLVSIQEA